MERINAKNLYFLIKTQSKLVKLETDKEKKRHLKSQLAGYNKLLEIGINKMINEILLKTEEMKNERHEN